MKAPLKWLRKYVDINVTVDEFIRRMIMCGFEVEEVIDPAADVSGIVIGRITRLDKHPNADKLQICTMDVGGGQPLQVVTGAPNVFEGATVPVAVVGAKLPGGIVIKKSKLRGVESEGMLCSGQELNIDDSWYSGASVDGILIFREDYRLGADAKAVLGIDEPIIDFKITANRAADCMSMLGLAREASVVLDVPLREPVSVYAEHGGSVGDYVKVSVLDHRLCPRYTARVIRNVKIAPSPLWMRQALAAAGVRPINNIVDITNYVMLETGQPMHAFDHRFLRGNEIVVRRAGAGEKLMTLDEKERTLSDSMLVIADGQGPVALAGIMGGEHSGIYDDTKTVVFEIANFEWSQVRLTSRALGMRTESSARFEKGLPQWLLELAMDRALSLVAELGAGEIVCGAADCREAEPQARSMDISIRRVCNLLGQDIDAGTIEKILQRLGFGVKRAGDTLSLGIPPWRQDVETFADIAEEVQRIYGYGTIPSIAPPGEALQGRRTRRQEDMLKLKSLLTGMGLNEAMSYSFMSPTVFDKLGLPKDHGLRDAVRILNPIGEDYSLMRTTMAPGVLRSLATNLNRKNSTVRLFEMGRTYRPNADARPREEGGYSMSLPCVETEMLCVGAADASMDFYTLKGIVETVLERFGVTGTEYTADAPQYYHPGRSAVIRAGGRLVGTLGELHPDAAEAFEIGQKAYLTELDVDAVLALSRQDCAIKPLPKYPAISRDLAVSVDKTCPVGGMLAAIRAAGGSLLESVELFDIYEGRQAGEGRKSVAFTLVFRAADHTLVDEEANACFDAVVQALNRSYSAEIRK